MTIQPSRIQTAVCVWIMCTCAGSWAESESGGFLARQFTRLASGDDGQIEQAVQALTGERDPAYYELALALFNGEVYLCPMVILTALVRVSIPFFRDCRASASKLNCFAIVYFLHTL